MGFWLTLALLLLAVSAIFLAWRVLQAYGAYEGLHVCACPADGTPVVVRLRTWRAALATVFRGRSSLKVAECSRWPERANCNQACVAEAEANCRILAELSRSTSRSGTG